MALLTAFALMWISVAYGQTCSQNQFRCKEGACIPEKWKCDGRVDCENSDTSDEDNCSKKTDACEKDQYQCKDKSCIPQRWVCDSQNDCDDLSDEDETLCSNEYKGLENLFSLTTPSEEPTSANFRRTSVHIQANALLHENAMTDKHDKDHMTSDTQDVEMTINNTVSSEVLEQSDQENQTNTEPIVGGTSLPETAAVASVSSDFVNDWNSTIESINSTAEITEACFKEQYQCTNKRCIPKGWVCDGDNDCGDTSDENKTLCIPGQSDKENQPKTEPIVGGMSLPETAASATVSSKYVDVWNNTAESKHSTDTCQEDQFKCATSHKCISQKWRCDDQSDCPDHSDEDGCGKSPTTVDPDGCEENFFQCTKDKACIEKSWVCDGFLDCEDGTDERANCPNRCDKTEYRCDNMYECIDEKQQCDGKEDCDDGSDEKSCKTFSRDHGRKDDLKGEDSKGRSTAT
ncbi:hypothetical protein ACJMK2_042400 [Sinanodonta woodiana]|uniref:Uncharacterized protein n=1 Tax=Sinanodonta woodiana TaxID=1069815 RepID=A0ABD3W931_SINWO